MPPWTHCDAFKKMCDDIERASGGDMPNNFVVTCTDVILTAQKHVHATASKKYIDSLNVSIS